MIDGAEEYRAELGSVRNAGVVRRTSFPSTVDEDWLSLDAFMLKIASRWQSVNQWKSMTTAIVRSDSTLTVRKNIVLSYTYIHHTYYQSCVSCLTLLTCSHVSRNIYEIYMKYVTKVKKVHGNIHIFIYSHALFRIYAGRVAYPQSPRALRVSEIDEYSEYRLSVN